MDLPDGISGFHYYTEGDVAPKSDFLSFKQQISAVMSAAGYKPVGYEKSGITPNFHVGLFSKGDVEIAVLCNAEYPVIALAERPEFCNLQFIELPELEAQLESYTSYRLLTKSQLEAGIEDADLDQLNRAECSQIRYWEPANIGEIIFNWWD